MDQGFEGSARWIQGPEILTRVDDGWLPDWYRKIRQLRRKPFTVLICGDCTEYDRSSRERDTAQIQTAAIFVFGGVTALALDHRLQLSEELSDAKSDRGLHR
jgi:hypothetical protein